MRGGVMGLEIVTDAAWWGDRIDGTYGSVGGHGDPRANLGAVVNPTRVGRGLQSRFDSGTLPSTRKGNQWPHPCGAGYDAKEIRMRRLSILWCGFWHGHLWSRPGLRYGGWWSRCLRSCGAETVTVSRERRRATSPSYERDLDEEWIDVQRNVARQRARRGISE